MSGVRACDTTEKKDQGRALKILNVVNEVYVKKRLTVTFSSFFPGGAYMLNLCVLYKQIPTFMERKAFEMLHSFRRGVDLNM